MLYSISVLDTYLRKQVNVLVIIFVLASAMPCIKISTAKIVGTGIFRILAGFLTTDFSIDCKY